MRARTDAIDRLLLVLAPKPHVYVFPSIPFDALVTKRAPFTGQVLVGVSHSLLNATANKLFTEQGDSVVDRAQVTYVQGNAWRIPFAHPADTVVTTDGDYNPAQRITEVILEPRAI